MYEIANILPRYTGAKHIVRHDQGVSDIITGMLSTHNQYKTDYDKIAAKFWKGSTLSTAKCIYNFLAKNTHYKIEPDSYQTLRSPSAILYLGGNKNVGLDCKSYSLFTAGILDALNRQGKKINWCYRFASYKIWSDTPHHVFIVINPDTNNEIWIDNVLPYFNQKKLYQHKIDKKIMALVALSGIGRAKRTKAERKEKRRARKEQIKTAIKKKGRVLLKFNPVSAASRNSFLLLVKLNVFNLAKRLSKVDLTKLKKFWAQFGGNADALIKNINTGAKIKPTQVDSVNGIGVLPAIAAAIAAATPIVLKVTQFLKQNGIKTDDLQKFGSKVINKIIDKKADEQAAREETIDDGTSEETTTEEQPTEQSDAGTSEETTDQENSIEGLTFKPNRRSNYSRCKIGDYA